MCRFWLLILFTFSHCYHETYILREPIEGTSPGAIAFGLFIFTSQESQSTPSIQIQEINHFSTVFTNLSKTKNTDFPFTRGETKIEKKIDNVKILSSSNTILKKEGRNVFFLISDLDTTNEYTLRSVSYSYTISIFNQNGTTSDRTYFVTLPMDIELNKKLLNFTVMPNSIHYLGIFGIHETVDMPGIPILRIGETKKGILQSGEEILKCSGNKRFQKQFFGDHEITFRGGEKHFYQLLKESHPSGYWSQFSRVSE